MKKNEQDVSDVYVRLGNDFNAAVAAFASYNIDMAELAQVPDELRQVLELCLSEEANQQTLDQYLPAVRKIITRLLQGLRSKQSIYRQVVSDSKQRSSTISDGATSSRPESRASRTSRRDTAQSTRSSTRDTLQSSDSLSRRSATSQRRHPSASSTAHASHVPSDPGDFVGGFALAAPPVPEPTRTPQPPPRQEWAEPMVRPPSRSSSVAAAEARSVPQPEVPPVPRPPSSVQHVPSHVKRYSLVDRPVTSPTPPPTAPTPPPVVVEDQPAMNGIPTVAVAEDSPPLPPPPFLDSPPPDAPAVQSSLAALKQSDALERRASKRFSSYNITKMTGNSFRVAAANRRSMAVSSALTPVDLAVLTEENEDDQPTPGRRERSKPRSRNPSPILEDEEESVPPVPPVPSASRGPSPMPSIKSDAGKDLPPRPSIKSRSPSTEPSTPQTSFPVFLQVGREVKKVVIEPGLTFASLRVLFVDRFSYSPGQGNFPAIYIRDPASGVQYELEDMDEVKEKCLLSLNIEPLDQIKQHIDLQMSSLAQEIKDLRTTVSQNRRNSTTAAPMIIGQPLGESTPQAPRPSDRQLRNVARRLSRIIPPNEEEVTPRGTPEPIAPQTTGMSLQPQMTGASVTSEYSTRIVTDLKNQFDEVQNLRRDLGIMRQLYTDFMKNTKESLTSLRSQTQNVRQLANAKVGGARAYIDDGKAKLDSRSQNVLTRMEELQDTVEAIKDDVLKRNISPRPQVLKKIKDDVQAVSGELQSLKDHINTVKPMWKKTWEEELQNIVEEQQFLTHQEEFLGDLLEDHKAVIQVYGHVEKVISLRGSGSSKSKGRSFRPPPPEEGHNGLETVLLEIRGSAADAERRLKAIAATEKQREKGLKDRSDEFQSELSGFVQGKKLKMTGGADEVERVRQKRNDMTLKAMFTGGSSGPGSASSSAAPSPGLPMSPSGASSPASYLDDD
ncbi:AIP3 domain-containing protein [Phanerochaete sordida]|uniref:AIP3 domain-containing protein n=1 Tax=Phanerochaete sordida TaxID=48140 RepID=A0A9P3G6X4_9APHY|nr:AIP3 domain-containing protein [Phanerochaete sordida]